MRLILPPLSLRKQVVALLDAYYEAYQQENFSKAIALLSEWYHLDEPTVRWYEYLGGGRTGGQVTEDGVILLQSPENWKRSKSVTQGGLKWTRMVIHEFAHYYLWANCEEKAELFERRFVQGTRKENKGGT